MNDPMRRLRADARHLIHGKVPAAIRHPAPFRMAALALARPPVKGLTRVRLAPCALLIEPDRVGVQRQAIDGPELGVLPE